MEIYLENVNLNPRPIRGCQNEYISNNDNICDTDTRLVEMKGGITLN
jgi:hypothetical protein